MSIQTGKSPKRTLPVLGALHVRIAARSASLRDEYPFWPCAEGCDHCCRTLPSLPVVTAAEWQALREALTALPGPERADVERRILDANGKGPLPCPLLDEKRGMCRVYEARPIVCRTYGFYTDWDAGLYCHKVATAVAQNGAAETVVWGNGEAISYDMKELGETRTLDAWLREE